MDSPQRKQRNIILPKQVIDKVRSNAANGKEAAIGLQLAHAIYGRAIFQKLDLHEWFDVPFQTLKGVCHGYNNYLQLLKGVIEFNKSWQNKRGTGQCKKARFVIGGFHVTDFAAVPMASKPPKPLSNLEAAAAIVYKRLSIKIGSETLTDQTPFLRSSLIIAKLLTATFTEGYFNDNGKHLKPINDDERQVLKTWEYDPSVKRYCLKAKRKDHAPTMTGSKYKELCSYYDAVPIHYKRCYVTGVTDVKQFISEKLTDIQTSAYFTLNAIIKGEQLPHRNDTNRRLDSAFTALPNVLSKHLLLDGQPLICQDLANSQFVILARLILNSFNGQSHFANINTTNFVKTVQGFVPSDDIKRFCATAANGTLYDDFATANGLSRNEAKEAFMFIGFSKPTTPHRFKKVFAKTYPSVFDILQKFKKEYGHEQLPILLQKIESSIFIDHILFDCLVGRLSVLTKHDSIYFAQKEQSKVNAIIKKHLDKYLVEYKLKDE